MQEGFAEAEDPALTASTTRSRLYNAPIYKFLVDNFPDYRWKKDRLDVDAFAKATKMSKEGVYKWLRGNKISVEGAARLRELNPGIDKRDLVPFLQIDAGLLPYLNL